MLTSDTTPEVGRSNPAFDGFVGSATGDVGELPMEDSHDEDAPVIEIAENSNLIITSPSTNNNNIASVKDIPLSPMKSLRGAADAEEDDDPAVMDVSEDSTVVISSEKFRTSHQHSEKLIDTSKSSVNPLEEEESSTLSTGLTAYKPSVRR